MRSVTIILHITILTVSISLDSVRQLRAQILSDQIRNTFIDCWIVPQQRKRQVHTQLLLNVHD